MGMAEEESELEEIDLWPSLEDWEWPEGEEVDLAHPRLYLTSFLCLPFCLCFFSGDAGSRGGCPTLTARARRGRKRLFRKAHRCHGPSGRM